MAAARYGLPTLLIALRLALPVAAEPVFCPNCAAELRPDRAACAACGNPAADVLAAFARVDPPGVRKAPAPASPPAAVHPPAARENRLLDRATAALDAGELLAATNFAKALLVRDPDCAEGYYILAAAAFRGGDFDLASRRLALLLQRRPDHAAGRALALRLPAVTAGAPAPPAAPTRGRGRWWGW